jgi:siroheme synthase (precorrin-2 oxidase/ferrochelatase)
MSVNTATRSPLQARTNTHAKTVCIPVKVANKSHHTSQVVPTTCHNTAISVGMKPTRFSYLTH